MLVTLISLSIGMSAAVSLISIEVASAHHIDIASQFGNCHEMGGNFVQFLDKPFSMLADGSVGGKTIHMKQDRHGPSGPFFFNIDAVTSGTGFSHNHVTFSWNLGGSEFGSQVFDFDTNCPAPVKTPAINATSVSTCSSSGVQLSAGPGNVNVKLELLVSGSPAPILVQLMPNSQRFVALTLTYGSHTSVQVIEGKMVIAKFDVSRPAVSVCAPVQPKVTVVPSSNCQEVKLIVKALGGNIVSHVTVSSKQHGVIFNGNVEDANVVLVIDKPSGNDTITWTQDGKVMNSFPVRTQDCKPAPKPVQHPHPTPKPVHQPMPVIHANPAPRTVVNTLPFTGAEQDLERLLAILSLGLGFGLIFATKKRRPVDENMSVN